MASFNVPDPDVLIKWVRTIRDCFNWIWKTVSLREARSSRELAKRLDVLVGNIWPYLSVGSARLDSLRCVLDEVTRTTTDENQKIRAEILRRYRVVGEWLSFLNMHLKHHLLIKPTRIGVVDSVVELRAIITEFERVMDDFSLSSSIASASSEQKKNYARFRDTYNRFLTDYEAFCREVRTDFREIQEPAFKRLE